MEQDLDQLFEAVQEINCRETLAYFISDLEETSQGALGCPRVRILHPDGTGHFSTRPGAKQFKIPVSRFSGDGPQYLSKEQSRPFVADGEDTLLLPIFSEDRVLLGFLALLDVPESYSVRSQSELGTLCTVAALAISRAYRARELKKQESEMSYAWEVLQSLLPAENLEYQGYECSGLLIPAREVGGDIYDYFAIPGDRLAFIIADAAGKGTGPCLQAATCRAYFRALVMSDETDLASIASRLNHLLFSDVKPDKFVTACFGWIDIEADHVHYVNAGHGSGYFAAQGKSDPIGSSDPPLGVLRGLDYQARQRQLEKGELLALFTDGWTERLIDETEEYGEEKLGQSLMNDGGSSREVLRHAYQSYELACRRTRQGDDVTALVLRRS